MTTEAVKALDTPYASDVLTNDPELKFAVRSGHLYMVDIDLVVDSSTDGVDALLCQTVAPGNDAADRMWAEGDDKQAEQPVEACSPDNTGESFVRLHARVYAGADGTCHVQFSNDDNGGTVTVKRGSRVTARQV